MPDVPTVNSGHPVWQAAFSAAFGVELVKNNSLPCHGPVDVRTEHAARQAVVAADKALEVVRAHDAEIEKRRHAAAIEVGKGLLGRKFYFKQDADPVRTVWVVDRFVEEDQVLCMRPADKSSGMWFMGIMVWPHGWDRRDFDIIEEPASP